jgi:hypothetical protein
VVSLVVHLVALGVFVRFEAVKGREPLATLYYLLDVPAAPPTPVLEEHPIPLPPLARRGRPLSFSERPSPPAEVAAEPIGEPEGDSVVEAPSGVRRGAGLAALQPQYGDGRLWVRPLVIPEGGGRPFDLDSVVRRWFVAFADTVDRNRDRDPSYNPYAGRPWTITRDGRTYGIDERGLHLGSFTIPTAALALLALPQGNIDQSRANRVLMEMRADLLRAAARAEAEDDFRQAVRGIRERWERERRERREAEGGERPRVNP